MSEPLYINDLYMPLLDDDSRYLILYGGSDSGKSHFAAQKKIARCIKERGHRFLLIRKIQRTIRHSQFDLIRAIITDNGLGSHFKPTPSILTISGPNNSEFIGVGVDDPEKLKSIHGITGAWVEEATDLTQEDFQEIDRRIRGEKAYYKQIIMSFNPITEGHWINREFFMDLPVRPHEIQYTQYRGEKVTILHSTYLDNLFVDPKDAARYEKAGGNEREVYTLGMWGGKTDPDQVITYDMIQTALKTEPEDGEASLGCDIAWEGDDKDVYTLICGNQVAGIYDYDYTEIDRKAAIIKNIAIENIVAADKVAIDVVGPAGPGTYERLRVLGLNPVKFIAGAAAIPGAFSEDMIRAQGYANIRAQSYFYARKLFLDGQISLVRKDSEGNYLDKDRNLKLLIADLMAVHYLINSDRKVLLEPKRQIKNRIGRSPDFSDSFTMGLFVRVMKTRYKLTTSQVKFI